MILERPLIAERSTYSWQTAGRRDWFMVKLLNEAIVDVLERWSREKSTSKRFLDVGCGNQPFRKLVENLGFCYESADANPQTVTQPTYLFRVDEALPDAVLSQEKFSYVLCTEVLEHVFDWDRAMLNLNQLLPVGGRLLITIPFLFPLHEEPEDYWRATPYALRKIAQKRGFKVEKFEKIGTSRDVLGQFLGDTIRWNGWRASLATSHTFIFKVNRFLITLFLRATYKIFISDWFLKHCIVKEDVYLGNVFELSKVAETS